MSTSVYQYYSSSGALLYVGVTDRGVRRLHEHAESKPWWPLTTGSTIEHFETRDEALAREKYLIQTYRPPFNHQHNPERNKPLEERSVAVGPTCISRSPAAGMKQRKQAWYELPRHLRMVAPCVRCSERPGGNGPMCLPCRQSLYAAR